MFKKLAIALASLTLVGVPAGAASAGPPLDVEVPDFIQLLLDADEGKSTWINITAPDFCAWALGGFMGPPPVVDAAVPATMNFTAKDGEAVVASVKSDDLYIEVWNLDDPDGPFLGPCEDIQDQLLAGSDPWATGTTSVNAQTNNLFFPPAEPRTVSDGVSGTALLDVSGESYRYHFANHGSDRCTDFRCFVMNTSLRMI